MDGQSPKTLVAVGASDSAGTDGIAADIRTFAAMGVHGTAVVTGILAKRGDDTEVVAAIPAGEIVRQIESALVVTGAEVVKIGWMPDAESVASVSQALDRASIKHVVADPDLAHAEDALKDALKTELMPVTEVVTISMPEATALLGIPIRNALGLRAVGKLLDRAGARTCSRREVTWAATSAWTSCGMAANTLSTRVNASKQLPTTAPAVHWLLPSHLGWR